MSSMSLSNNQKNELLFVGFNQDYGERCQVAFVGGNFLVL